MALGGAEFVRIQQGRLILIMHAIYVIKVLSGTEFVRIQQGRLILIMHAIYVIKALSGTEFVRIQQGSHLCYQGLRWLRVCEYTCHQCY